MTMTLMMLDAKGLGMAGVVVPLRDQGNATLDNVLAGLMLLPV